MPNYVPGIGPGDAKLMFVGEAPGAVEDFQQQPFVGPTGDLLNECLREVGIDRREVYITNVIKYRPPDNKLKRLGEIRDKHGNPVTIEGSISQLWDEIRAINPNCIVGLGNLALKAVFGKGNGFKGITKWRGSILPSVSMGYKGVATLHPASLLHAGGELEDERPSNKKKGPLKYSYRHVLKLDLLKAKRQAEFRSYDPPNRVLEIARDSVALDRFLAQYKDKDIVSVDIEVLKSVPFCIGLAFNEWHAISVPLLDVFGWQNLGGIHDHQLAEMWRMVATLLDSPRIKVIGQNFKFDQRQLARLCGIYIKNFHCDTSLLAHALHPEFPKALEFNTSIYTDEPYYKEEGREFDWKRDKVDRFLTYNGRDAAVTFEIYTEMMKDAHENQVAGFPNWVDDFVLGHVMSLHTFYYELEDVGFNFDHRRQKELAALYEEKVTMAQNELDALAGWHVNTRSPKDVPALVFVQLGYPFRRNCNEDSLISLIANHSNKKPMSSKRMLELILTIRRLRLNKKKIFEARVDYDGRMRTVYTIAGTETGRSATKILQPPVRPEKIGTPFHLLTKHGDIGSEAREPYIADPGYVIVETDMSQAEARIVALFGNDTKLLELFNQKADIHKITAAIIFGVKVVDVTKELRFIGKTCRHAGNYDMGKRRLMELVNTDAKKYKINISLSEWKAGILLDKFHAFSPSIRKVFHEEIQQALQKNNRVLVNPFGRYRQFFDRWGRELFKEAYAHLPQSTVPDHLRRAGIRAKERFIEEAVDARFVIEAHDALVGLVREDQVDRYVRIVHQEIEKPIDFSRCTLSRGNLVIPAESKFGLSYKECEDKDCKGCKFLHKYEALTVAA